MKLFKYFLAVFLFCCSANAQQITGDTTAAIQNIVMGTGQVTKAEYDAFWNALGVKTEVEKAKAINSMKDNFITMQSYQKEMWNCAERSWVSRKKESCQTAKNIIAKMKSKNIKQQQEMISNLEKTMDNLLEAAAKRGAYSLDGTNQITLTLEFIRSTKTSVTKMLERFEQVLTVKYKAS